jgi:hypothetical protein
MTLLAQNETKMQQRMNTVQQFEAWSGIRVNTTKTKLMTLDGVAANWTDAIRITYTPNGNMQSAMDLVFDRTLKAKQTIQGHPLDPKQAIEVFAAKAVGNFRYLATALWRR